MVEYTGIGCVCCNSSIVVAAVLTGSLHSDIDRSSTSYNATIALGIASSARGVQRHPWRRKMRHRNPRGTKIRKLGDKVYLFVLRENKCIKPIKQSNSLSINYE